MKFSTRKEMQMQVLTTIKERASYIVAAVVAMMLVSAPAFAQAAGNPFADAGSELETWIGYGMTAGVIGVVTLAAIGLGKAIFRRLAS